MSRKIFPRLNPQAVLHACPNARCFGPLLSNPSPAEQKSKSKPMKRRALARGAILSASFRLHRPVQRVNALGNARDHLWLPECAFLTDGRLGGFFWPWGTLPKLRRGCKGDVHDFSNPQTPSSVAPGPLHCPQHGHDSGRVCLDRRGFAAVWCDHGAAAGKKGWHRCLPSLTELPEGRSVQEPPSPTCGACRTAPFTT